jgi:hypothetical protein
MLLLVVVVVIDDDVNANTDAVSPERDGDEADKLFLGLVNCLKGIHSSSCKRT